MQPLANKYRPRCLDEVIGQESVVRTLSNAIKNNSLHHAYLFIGNYGSGKTSICRVLAMSENCLVSPGLRPCGTCDLCVQVYEGKHTDIEEIDAASSAGKVDQIRELKQDALYNPIAGAKTKVFILDEAHRMSAESAEALLKVLEEPPPRVRFMLCTTDPQKIKPTIESRCQRHDIRKIPWSVMSEHLSNVCSKEKLVCEQSALNLCARLASGSMRQALQNLDKLIAYSGSKEINIADAQTVFAQADEMLYYGLLDQVVAAIDARPDASEGFKIINNIVGSGIEFQHIYEELISHLRNLMVGLTASKAGEFLSFSEEGKRRLQTQLKKCKESQKLPAILESIRYLHDAKKSVEYNIPPDVALQQWFIESVFAFKKA